MDSDFRPSIRKLVDCAKKSEEFQSESHIASLTAQVEKMREERDGLASWITGYADMHPATFTPTQVNVDILLLSRQWADTKSLGKILSRLTQKGT